MKAKLEELIKAAMEQAQSTRREGILLEAALRDAEARYAALQGRLAALREILNMEEVDETQKG